MREMCKTVWIATLLIGLIGATPAQAAVQVQDLVRIKGAESSKLVGMGLVMGLNGTGDGDKSLPTMRRLAAMMGKLGDTSVMPVELREAENVAVVYLSATLPRGGVREGDQIDVQLSAPIAESLRGGRLVLSPLLGPIPGSPIYAFAEGPLIIEDPRNDRNAVVRLGAQLTRDIYAQYVDEFGRMTLVIDDPNATLPMANTLATLINDLMAPDSPPIAFARDQKNIVVAIPDNERRNPTAFISQILEIQIDPSLVRTESRVVINQKTGTITIDGNVELSPVIISHKGLTISTQIPPRQPTPQAPERVEQRFIAMDPARRGGARLQDLVAAFEQLKVPAEDQLTIVKQIHRSGKLHAKLILVD